MSRSERMSQFYLAFIFYILTNIYGCHSSYCNAKDTECRKAGIRSGLHNKLLVAAIDFGTTYSGWAFSFLHEYLKDPTDISFSQWSSGEYVSLKAPTTVLINPDGETLNSFGYEAETKYAELAGENEHHDYYYFKHFKMMLFGKKDLTRYTTIEDDKQHVLPAINVFALAIQYLRQNLNATLQRRDSGLVESDIFWVLTVPAIWNDDAKQFMREAAVQGGIDNANLMIALEPEAASLYTRLLPIEKMIDDYGSPFISTFETGAKYMVLDAGGGTVDITVHEVMEKGHLKALYKASGGPWGGTKVDTAFTKMLETLLGDEILKEFRMVCLYDHLELFRNFEIKKRQVAPDKNTKIMLRLPQCLRDLFEKTGEQTAERIASSTFGSQMRLNLDKLSISADIAKELFHETLDSIINEVRELLEKSELLGTNTILLVGGFAESPMLQHAIRSTFFDKKIVIPKEAGLAVVKGAVVFGYNPSLITERVSKYTYGIAVNPRFNEGIHDPAKKFFVDGICHCKDVFSRFVTIGQTVKFGEPQGFNKYIPLRDESTDIDVEIYACVEKAPMYVTDKGCSRLGHFIVKVLDRSVPRDERKFLVKFTFSGTEIEVTAVEERTGEETSVFVNFLGDIIIRETKSDLKVVQDSPAYVQKVTIF